MFKNIFMKKSHKKGYSNEKKIILTKKEKCIKRLITCVQPGLFLDKSRSFLVLDIFRPTAEATLL